MALYTEDKVDTRKVLYLLTSLGGIIASLFQAFHLIDSPTADNIGGLLQALGQFLPTAGVTAAGIVLARQSKTPGMLQPNAAPADMVLNGMGQLIADKVAANDAVKKVQEGAQAILGTVLPAGLKDDIDAAARALGLPG